MYLDIDGVLLGKVDPASHEIVLARHAETLLRLATSRFDAYWLTTHCDGTTQSVLDYISPYCPAPVGEMLLKIKPAHFRTMKTEALKGDFWWIDDAPLAVEIEWLESRGLRDRWIQVDTRRRPDDLLRAIEALERLP